ncbi:hypothetical protein CYY_005901 [Polysphondylium violaceum]|uniref:RNA polymerase II subunit A C-terminal domain phosphatase SSU72 n=1 Tax=Polysphondylium violaceum TaxID=133409 RepID=A0A8J4V6F2_9MYCE|nr:hypothetical protein CYY_005901 [Polysphondylium violaceum]
MSSNNNNSFNNSNGIKRLAMVCASNQNRSLEAHNLFNNKGVKGVRSFGTSAHCKLPGPSIDKPNVFPFGTAYQSIYDSLKHQNVDLYTQNGILNMLERNIRVKLAPERWQEEVKQKFDLVFTFDQRVYDMVIDDLAQRDIGGTGLIQPIHVINLQVKDTHEEAVGGALHAYDIYTTLSKFDDWDDSKLDWDEVLDQFYKKTGRQLLHCLMFY